MPSPHPDCPSSTERPVLIIDGSNLFIRSYAAYPQMSSHGYQMGGAIGFLKKTRTLVDELQPKAVYVVWESGGSPRRRRLYSEYKRGSRPMKLNRFYEDDLPDTKENRIHQMVALLEFLKSTPVCQLYVKDCEADDVIAWLCKSKFRTAPKILVSSDKDMYQLLDPLTTQYSLHKKAIVTMEDVYSEFHVMPWNFALAKALCGDPSDNIPGVKGMGFKTAVKKIPLLATHQDIILQDIFDFCHSHVNESAVLRRVIDESAQVKTNWRLVYLDTSSLTPSQAAVINGSVDTFKPRGSKMSFIRALIQEGINDFDVDSFLYSFMSVDGYTFTGG